MDGLLDLRSRAQQPYQPDNVEIGPNDLSIDLLRAIYRNNSLPLHTRMRAAMAVLKHEVPSLGVSLVVNDSDIATRLDQAIARSNGMRLIGGPNGNTRTPEPPPKPEPILPSPLSRIYSTKFRRRI